MSNTKKKILLDMDYIWYHNEKIHLTNLRNQILKNKIIFSISIHDKDIPKTPHGTYE